MIRFTEQYIIQTNRIQRKEYIDYIIFTENIRKKDFIKYFLISQLSKNTLSLTSARESIIYFHHESTKSYSQSEFNPTGEYTISINERMRFS